MTAILTKNSNGTRTNRTNRTLPAMAGRGPQAVKAVLTPELETFRREAARSAMQGLLANPDYAPSGISTACMIEDAIHYADSLIAGFAGLSLTAHGRQ